MKTVKKPFSEDVVIKKMKALSGWEVNKKGTEIHKTFKTTSFVAGLSFVARIAVHAEVLGHHPVVELSYTSVVVTLSTHDVKGLTQNDFELAKKIDAIHN